MSHKWSEAFFDSESEKYTKFIWLSGYRDIVHFELNNEKYNSCHTWARTTLKNYKQSRLLSAAHNIGQCKP